MKSINILSSESIRSALQKISKSGTKCIAVVDNKNKLLGTLSDGDIRRAILKKAKLSKSISSIYNKKPFYFIENQYSLEKIKKYFLNNKIDIIPVVNNRNQLVKIINWNEIFKNNKVLKKIKDLQVVIMAGGKGTRLKPFTNILPKPLIPIKDNTAIELIIENLISYGLDNFTISIHEKSEIIKAFFHELQPKYKVNFIKEPKPLGTIGSLKLLKKNNLKNNILVTNCDILSNFDLIDFYNFHKDNHFDLTMVASEKRFEIPYGVCKIFNEGTLKSVEEKPSFDFLVNIGIYIINKKIINLVPKNKLFNANELINRAKKKGFKVGVFPVSESNWQDTGQWSEFSKIKL